MKSIAEPNYELMYKSAVTALQTTYTEYKKVLQQYMSCTFIDDCGRLCVLSGYKDRKAEIDRLTSEIECLSSTISELEDHLS